jgi:FKBP-type peptidyl-prolyl cis-trans isomerase FkpA
MNRAVLIILLFVVGLAACKKAGDLGSTAEKAQAVVDDKIITDYLSANPGLQATKIDTTGVYYIINQPGTGNALFTNSTMVTVGYTGRVLKTGQIFSQTNSFQPSFSLGQMIRGWQLGIPLLKKGGSIRLFLPSRYAYGPYPQPLLGVSYGLKDGLPGAAVLDFDIDLYDITN